MVVPKGLSKAMHSLLIAGTLLLSIASCKKDATPSAEKAANPVMPGSVPHNLVLNKVMRDSVNKKTITCSNNLKQIGLALHNYHDANLVDELIAYEYDAEGRLLATLHCKKGKVYVYEHNAAGQVSGYRLYADGNRKGRPEGSARYRYNGAGLLSEVKLFDARGYATESRVYAYHSDGQVASIKYYEHHARAAIQLGMIFTQGSASRRQVEAWKWIAAQFPEPELPWEILTMLSDRIETEGTIPDAEVPNGGQMQIESIEFNAYGLVDKKTMRFPRAAGEIQPVETISFYYNKL